MSDSLKDLFEHIFKKNAKQRYSLQDILNCNWMKGETITNEEFIKIIHKKV